jgi:dihydroorotase
VIEPSEVRILAYLHVSFAGIFAFSSSVMVGESEDLRLMAPAEAARVADENRDVIVGIKARVGRRTSGVNGATPLKYALEVADQVGMPVMLHVDDPPPAYEDVLDMLRPGDVLTHCFRPFPNAPVQAQGAIKPGVLRARERGVIFDIGHGKGSLSFKVARQMLGVIEKAAKRYGFACALALGLERDYFVKTMDRMDLCTMRYLHYPPCDSSHIT